MRKIIHIDMDAFYASIEQRDNPNLRDKPIAVGYAGERGVVASASYEARRYGVRSAMSSKVALKKCPQLIFVRSNFEVYQEVSNQIMDIFHEYTDLVEPLSLDEAFLDVTTNFKNKIVATEIAEEIRKRIYDETSLTASAGVSFNKFLAKIASDCNKPNGTFVIKPQQAERFIEELPIEKFFGVGKVTAKKMHDVGIKTGSDLKGKTEAQLVGLFGKAGYLYYQNARAIDEREVNPNRVRKSVGAENTFSEDIDDIKQLAHELKIVAEDVTERIEQSSFMGKTITLKIKYSNFKIITRSRTLPTYITNYATLYNTGYEMLQQLDLSPKVRLLGLSIKTSETQMWASDAIQLELEFED